MKRIGLLLIGILVFVVAVTVVALRSNDSSKQRLSTKVLVALGDSVTAGDGLHATEADDPVACQRSDLAYPYVIAKDTGLQLHQFACSGAKVTTGLLEPQGRLTGRQSSQLEDAQPYLKGSDVVLTIGVNDVGGLELLATCAQQTSCLSSDQAARYKAALPRLSDNLDRALAMIQATHPHKVVLNVYYTLLGKDDRCFQRFGLTGDKVKLVSDEQSKLSDVLHASAKKAHVIAVDIDFTGHGLCGDPSWIQGLISKSPLHPTKEGQAQIAAQDEQVLYR